MNLNKTIRVLLVEDDASDAHLVKTNLKQTQSGVFDITWAQSLIDAQRHLSTSSFNVILLDLSLPDSEGLATVYAMKAMQTDIPIVVLSGHGDTDFTLDVENAETVDYRVKGDFDYGGLGWMIQYTLLKNETKVHNKLLQRRLADYTMAYNLISRLIPQQGEQTITHVILELFYMLCAPHAVHLLLIQDNGNANTVEESVQLFSMPATIECESQLRTFLHCTPPLR